MWRADSLEKCQCWERLNKRRRGQWRLTWLDSITNSMHMNVSKLWETLEDRRAWRAAVHGITKSGTQLRHWTTMTAESILALNERLSKKYCHWNWPPLFYLGLKDWTLYGCPKECGQKPQPGAPWTCLSHMLTGPYVILKWK